MERGLGSPGQAVRVAQRAAYFESYSGVKGGTRGDRIAMEACAAWCLGGRLWGGERQRVGRVACRESVWVCVGRGRPRGVWGEKGAEGALMWMGGLVHVNCE